MQVAILILLFVGVVLVMQSIYEEKIEFAKKGVQIEYKFIPRTEYEEQMYGSNLQEKTRALFSKDNVQFGIDTLGQV